MELLTRHEIAERLQVSYKKAGDLIRTMPTVRIGRRIRVSEQDLETWLRARREQPSLLAVAPQHPSVANDKAVLTPQGKIPRRGRLREV